MKMDYKRRLKIIREKMSDQNIGLLFLNFGANLFYLSGISRKGPELTESNSYGDYICGAYIGNNDNKFTIVVPRMRRAFFIREAKGKSWIKDIRIIDEKEKPKEVLNEVLKTFQLNESGISLDDRSWIKSGLLFQHILPNTRIYLASDIIMPMRMVKDKDEIALMKKAGKITDDVFEEIIPILKVGITEHDVASEIDYQLGKRGVEYNSFPTTVQFSEPNKPREMDLKKVPGKKLEKGNSITFDFGACYKGYCSDFGRTLFIGKPPKEFYKIYEIVMKSQSAAITMMINKKITAMQLDKISRNIIKKAGYGNYFIHRLGHGIGITVHEPPYLYHPDKTVLTSGMILTIEPSIRLPNSFACRVEDAVLVTDNGGLPLTNFKKELILI